MCCACRRTCSSSRRWTWAASGSWWWATTGAGEGNGWYLETVTVQPLAFESSEADDTASEGRAVFYCGKCVLSSHSSRALTCLRARSQSHCIAVLRLCSAGGSTKERTTAKLCASSTHCPPRAPRSTSCGTTSSCGLLQTHYIQSIKTKTLPVLSIPTSLYIYTFIRLQVTLTFYVYTGLPLTLHQILFNGSIVTSSKYYKVKYKLFTPRVFVALEISVFSSLCLRLFTLLY